VPELSGMWGRIIHLGIELLRATSAGSPTLRQEYLRHGRSETQRAETSLHAEKAQGAAH